MNDPMLQFHVFNNLRHAVSSNAITSVRFHNQVDHLCQ